MEPPGQTKTNQKKPRRRQSIFQLLQSNSVFCPKKSKGTSFANWLNFSYSVFDPFCSPLRGMGLYFPHSPKLKIIIYYFQGSCRFHADFSPRFLSLFSQRSGVVFLNQLLSLRNIDLEHNEDDWGIRNVVERFLEFLSQHDLLRDTWKYSLTTGSWA